MKIKFLKIAQIELEDAIEYYEYQVPKLGYRFLKEIEESLTRIVKFSDAYPKIGKYTRRCLVKDFPYAILYYCEYDEIIITAVAHQHRNPVNYKNRLK